MSSAHSHPTIDALLDQLSPRDIAALEIGHYHMLRDLQDMQLAGRRLPGGLSGRIELASGYQRILRDGLEALAVRDPDKLLLVTEYLDLSSDVGIHQASARLTMLTRRTLTGQG